MKKFFTLVLALFTFSCIFAKAPKNQYVRIKTSYGQCIIRLYNETPKHRDNFIKLIKSKVLDSTLFHRIIQNFMIQGGDIDSKNAKPGIELGNGGLKYTVDAEFNDSLYHKRGVLAAARESDDVNPKKASASTQFYIVEGKRYTDAEMDKLEAGRLKGHKIPASHRSVYRTVGGTPQLDNAYTVFGEVVLGIDMVDLIAALPKDSHDRPLINVPITIQLLKKRECKQLDKLLGINP
ncbi:peptidyl-prolyl cis-trans isomerase B (cyclophilin B) [Mucilaginibacter gracilis]|uniref:Peptidyl-prolyl cis-trans isomerase n=1 Tax=Mucilaginibacter gracilis TaxID=423350 RepID=A0A495IWX9_9SPHI|nr:peptidylprolyl isomerase [Mucilaginibacter gracilis]RKR81180.1 peptidyl-prolyl cis-trans isomerase B (cyclophilin B) [Mucilaginibacter gracilis]